MAGKSTIVSFYYRIHIWFDGTSVTGLELPEGGVIKTLHLPASVTSLSVIGHPGMTVNIGPGIKTISATAFENTPDGMVINLPVADGAVANAPWGATNAVIHYNTPYSGNVPIPN